MRLLCDENVYVPIVKMLREIGHNVKDIKEERLFGVSDEVIYDLAKSENRILISFNRRHFGNIILFPPQNTSGIVIIKMPSLTIEKTTQIVKEFFISHADEDFSGKLVILEESGIRIRK